MQGSKTKREGEGIIKSTLSGVINADTVIP